MTVSGKYIFEDTFRRGFAWTAFQTLFYAGHNDFNFPSLVAQQGVFYTVLGAARYLFTQVDTLKELQPETQRALIYAAAFFTTCASITPIFLIVGRNVTWQQLARQSAGAVAFWYILNPTNEFQRSR